MSLVPFDVSKAREDALRKVFKVYVNEDKSGGIDARQFARGGIETLRMGLNSPAFTKISANKLKLTSGWSISSACWIVKGIISGIQRFNWRKHVEGRVSLTGGTENDPGLVWMPVKGSEQRGAIFQVDRNQGSSHVNTI